MSDRLLEALIAHEAEAVKKAYTALQAFKGIDFRQPGYRDRSLEVLAELRRISRGSGNYLASLRSARKQMREELGLEV